MFTDSHERLVLCAYWICVIYVSVRRFYSISKQSKTERILLRKYYHLVAVLIFSPAVIFQVVCAFLGLISISPKTRFNFHQDIKYFGLKNILQPAFLDLAFGAAFAVFLILEMLRVRDPILLSSQVLFLI
jgi:dolichol kinase